MEEQSQEQVVENQDIKSEEVQEEKPKQNASGSSFYKQKLAEAEARAERIASELEQERTKTLQEKENFKELWELEKNKRAEAEEKTRTLATTLFNDKRITAIKQEALKNGILDTAIDDLDMLDHSLVEIETTDRGNINVHGAKEYIEALKERKPHWFRKVGAPNINNSNPALTQPKELTAKEILALQKTDPNKYNEIMRKKLSIA